MKKNSIKKAYHGNPNQSPEYHRQNNGAASFSEIKHCGYKKSFCNKNWNDPWMMPEWDAGETRKKACEKGPQGVKEKGDHKNKDIPQDKIHPQEKVD